MAIKDKSIYESRQLFKLAFNINASAHFLYSFRKFLTLAMSKKDRELWSKMRQLYCKFLPTFSLYDQNGPGRYLTILEQ